MRRFTHVPMGRKTTWLHVTVPRYRCDDCGPGLATLAEDCGSAPVETDPRCGLVGAV